MKKKILLTGLVLRLTVREFIQLPSLFCNKTIFMLSVDRLTFVHTKISLRGWRNHHAIYYSNHECEAVGQIQFQTIKLNMR